jgi:predicted nucleic acid-binding protein
LVSIYADSSFFVSIYLDDSHTKTAIERLTRRPWVWLTPFHHAELVHAIAQQVFQRRLAQADADESYRNFELDRDAGVWHSVSFPESAFQIATALARAHVARLGTRTLDSLHVAAALELKAEQFWTFDERQARLAKAAGLKVR